MITIARIRTLYAATAAGWVALATTSTAVATGAEHTGWAVALAVTATVTTVLTVGSMIAVAVVPVMAAFQAGVTAGRDIEAARSAAPHLTVVRTK